MEMPGEGWLCIRGKGSLPTLENIKVTFWQQEKIYVEKHILRTAQQRKGWDSFDI